MEQTGIDQEIADFDAANGIEGAAEEGQQESQAPEAGEQSEGEGLEEGAEGQAQPEKPKKVYDEAYWKREYFKEKQRRKALERPAAPQVPSQQTPKKTPQDIKTVEELVEFMKEQLKAEHAQTFESFKKEETWKNSERAAREHFNGQGDWPSYDEIYGEFVEPVVEQNAKLKELLAEMPDPAGAAYIVGLIHKFQTPERLGEFFRGMGRSETVKKIEEVSKSAAMLKSGKREAKSSGKVTAQDIFNWTPEETEREIAKATGRPF